MNSRFALYASSFFGCAIGTMELSGCGQPGLVEGEVQSAQQEVVAGLSSVVSVTGHYVDNTCIDPTQTGAAKRTGSVAFSYPSATLAPSVVLHDKNCLLAIDSFTILDTTGTNRTAIPVAGSFNISKNAFASSAILFRYNDGMNHDFYVNAMLTPGDFSTNFIVNLIYSGTPDSVTKSQAGQYMTVGQSSFTSTGVSAPSYTLDLSTLYYQRASGKVTSAMGSINPTVTAGGQTAEDYQVKSGACPSGIVATKTAYTAPVAIATAVAPTALGLVANATLPITDCITLRHCDTSNVCSYQLFQVTFN